MHQTSSLRRPLAAVLLAATLVLAFAGTAGAREVASGGGGGGGGGGTCTPVTSLKTRADARAGETGLATMDVDYAVKSCTGAAVTVDVVVYRTLTPSDVVWDQPSAPLSGKFTVFGIQVRTSYTVKLTVRDAATGAVVGTGTASAAAIPKGV